MRVWHQDHPAQPTGQTSPSGFSPWIAATTTTALTILQSKGDTVILNLDQRNRLNNLKVTHLETDMAGLEFKSGATYSKLTGLKKCNLSDYEVKHTCNKLFRSELNVKSFMIPSLREQQRNIQYTLFGLFSCKCQYTLNACILECYRIESYFILFYNLLFFT